MRTVRVTAALVAATAAALAGEPPELRDLPGTEVGRLQARWIAPHVQESWARSGPTARSVVRWFEAGGSPAKEVRSPAHAAPDGHVLEMSGDLRRVHSTRAAWTVDLSAPPSPTFVAVTTPDHRHLIYAAAHPDGGTQFHVFVDGKRTATAGSYRSHRGSSPVFAQDGSFALLATGPGGPRLQAFGPGGIPALALGVREDAELVAVAPAARGVLLAASDGADHRKRFTFLDGRETRHTVEIGQNAQILGWAADSARALFTAGGAEPEEVILVDWATGKEGWRVRTAAGGGADNRRAAPRLACENGFALLSETEVAAQGSVRRRIRALDLATGKQVAEFTTSYGDGIPPTPADFHRTADGLYLVTEKLCSRVEVADIRAKQRGWR